MTQQGVAPGVELTAVFIAASRAIETDRPDGLVTDPYAAKFVRAAVAAGSFSGRGFSPGDEIAESIATLMGLRTRYFDTYLTSRTDRARQVVLMAAGLDARAYRLPWPVGTTVYELDKPAMFGFKDSVLAAEGALPACTRRTVGVDLREDWTPALHAAGFDPKQPTVWLIEGLLMYLSAQAQDGILNAVVQLSAPGSAIAADHIPDVPTLLADERFIAASSKAEGYDAKALYNAEPKEDPATRLSRQGWKAHTVTPTQTPQGRKRTLEPLLRLTAHYTNYLVADLPTPA